MILTALKDFPKMYDMLEAHMKIGKIDMTASSETFSGSLWKDLASEENMSE